jgi:predicted metalloendopeptidase
MTPRVTITSTQSPGDRSQVCHFDELSEQAKDSLVRMVDNDIAAGVDPDVATELVQYDLIKFVEYYDVQLSDSRASGSVSA